MNAKRLLIMVGFILQLFAVADLSADPAAIRADESARERFISVSLPRKDRLKLVTVLPVTSNGQTLGGVATYDDTMTKRPADYVELFNNLGALLAVGWIDNFGIERLAVDRALVEHADTLEGVYVLVPMGEPI